MMIELSTYIHTLIYIHTCIRTYIHTYIQEAESHYVTTLAEMMSQPENQELADRVKVGR